MGLHGFLRACCLGRNSVDKVRLDNCFDPESRLMRLQYKQEQVCASCIAEDHCVGSRNQRSRRSKKRIEHWYRYCDRWQQ